jgi:AcrR family transcriptional regulator
VGASMQAEASVPGGRRRNKRGNGDQLRADLIAGASQLLETVGSEEALSLRAVARQVGVAPPSVYLHFADKHQLMHAVLDARFAELGARLDAAAAATTDPFSELQQRCLAYCAFAEEQHGSYRVMFSAESMRSDASFEELPGSQVFTGLVEAVQRCVQAQIIGAVDVFAVSALIWCNLHGIATLRRSKPVFPWPPLDVMIDRMLLAHCGLAATPTRTGRRARVS